jgi:hypothetical protein
LPKLTILDCPSPKSIVPDSGECKTTIVLSNGTGKFGAAQDVISGAGATDGVFRTVVISASQGDYVAGVVNSWTNNTVKVKMHQAQWFTDADGDFLRDTGEPETLACDGLNVGTYSVYFKYIFYSDDDSSASYTNGDTVFQIETSNPVYFELTNAPWLTGVNPADFAKGDRVKVIGLNFGTTQTDGQVFIGSKAQYNPAVCYGKDCYGGVPTGGKLQDGVKAWSSTAAKVKVKAPAGWVGKTRYVWVVKDGKVSNAKKVKILP